MERLEEVRKVWGRREEAMEKGKGQKKEEAKGKKWRRRRVFIEKGKGSSTQVHSHHLWAGLSRLGHRHPRNPKRR